MELLEYIPPPIDYIPSYVEALVGLLVFGISIPSFLLSVPQRLRDIRDQYGNNATFFGIPWRRLTTVEVAVPIVVISIGLILLYQVPSPPFFCNNQAEQPTGLGCGIQRLYVLYAPVWVNALVIINIVITALFIWVLRSYDRDQIITRLTEVCREQAQNQQGEIDEELLQNLGELGELCAAGREKQGLLKTLDGLSDLEITPRSWLGIAQIVTQTAASGDERNVADALDILQEIFRNSSESNIGEASMKPFHNRDILGELENLFIQAFGTDSSSVLSQMMAGYDELSEQAPNDAAKAFLRIGRLALQKDFSHAVHALDKLNTLISELLDEHGGRCPINELDALYTYLALLAYFWNHGINTRKHAVTHLEELVEDYRWEDEYLHKLLSDAGEAMGATNLRTADMLEQMLFDIRQRVLVQNVLDKVKDLSERRQKRILLRYPSLESLMDAHAAALMACGASRTQADEILWQAEMF